MKFILFFIFITVTLASVSPKPPTSKLIQQKWERKVGKGKTETFRQEPSITAKEEKKVSLNAFEICLCGAFATAFGDFCLHPLDTIKVTQQTAIGALGFIDAAKQILRQSGPFGFYQGVVPYVTADGLSGAVKFATFELSKVFVEARIPLKFHPVAQFACAAGAMLACSVFLVPGEVLKTRLQAGVIKNLGEGIIQTIKQDGIGGLFAGYAATLVRDVPYTMLELGLYENVKTVMRKFRKKVDLDQQDELLAAALTGGVTAFITTPLDVIKTKLMMQSGSSAQFSGVWDAFVSTYKSGGVDALFVGCTARVAWLLPFTTIYLGVYEVAKKALLARKLKLGPGE